MRRLILRSNRTTLSDHNWAEFDFTGKHAFSWPRRADQTALNVGMPDYDPLFPFGYGLSYADDGALAALSEDPGIDTSMGSSGDVLFADGKTQAPWSIYGVIGDTPVRLNSTTWDGGMLSLSGVDRLAQEDSLRIDWREAGPVVRFATQDPVDFTRQSNGAMEVAFFAKNFGQAPARLRFAMGCEDRSDCGRGLKVTVASSEWREVRLSLACFADLGADLGALSAGLVIASEGAASIGIAGIRLASDTDGTRTCGDRLN